MSQLVLIADDSELARLTVARKVRAAGFEVVEHDSCASASSADASTLCCALLDYDLGDGSGVDVATTLRDGRASLPIAFFTSTSSEMPSQAALFGPIFAKPGDLDAAIAWVEQNRRPPDGVVGSLCTFSDRLCAELVRTNPANTVFSPLTIMAALAMLLGGADGETARQIANALSLTTNGKAGYGAVGDLLRRVSGGALRLAARIWAHRGLVIEPEFLSLTWHNFDAPCGHADFGDSVATAAEIDAWIAEHTGGKLKNVVSPEAMSPDAMLLLASAAYFKAQWTTPFRERATRDEPFTREDRSCVLVPMMHVGGQFKYAQGRQLELVELPYIPTRAGENLAMVIAVPRQIGHLPELKDALDAAIDLRPTEVELALPRFRFETKIQLNDLLATMGIVDAFSDAADFLRITQAELVKVSKTLHDACIEVNEVGTEAAAVTRVEFDTLGFEQRPEPKEVRADRPFLFFLRDRITGALLFAGWVADPKR